MAIASAVRGRTGSAAAATMTSTVRASAASLPVSAGAPTPADTSWPAAALAWTWASPLGAILAGLALLIAGALFLVVPVIRARRTAVAGVGQGRHQKIP